LTEASSGIEARRISANSAGAGSAVSVA